MGMRIRLSMGCVILLTTSLSFANFLENPDLQTSHVRTIMPPLKFEVDGKLTKNLKFWINIYTQYSTYQGLIHDAKYIDHVYEVLDLKTFEKRPEKAVREAKKKWKAVLLSLHRKLDHQKNLTPENLTDDERHVFQLFADIHETNKFLNAAHRKRLRFQLGQKDRFLDGLYQSGKYLPMMEEIFKKEGLPVELTRLPFVESSFNLKARSKVGASGIWQFMRSTGKLFLKINDILDERNDPVRATEAAARLLRMNYESLKAWPLAVTAYNHGRKGMMKAVLRVGSDDLDEIVKEYRSRKFGFASSNFFTELLAAIEVEKNFEKYFGKVVRAEPVLFVEVEIPDSIKLPELAHYMNLDLAKLKELNPGFSESVFSGKKKFPAGYRLRMSLDGKTDPEIVLKMFQAGYSQIPKDHKAKGQRKVGYGRGVSSKRD